ncbi:hypothetical protein BRO54_0322 [Geobacillus proteiniphilus]|uniref:Uncharacterized protein n=1 Tax=Geobacillus proteiniphilus TaxID=860353 RepID=A0A1Q5T955_9BACL|nr:hypothetical protein BRO54_0322 [Geobacillus proteiniphilus]
MARPATRAVGRLFITAHSHHESPAHSGRLFFIVLNRQGRHFCK